MIIPKQNRLNDIQRFYEILHILEHKISTKLTLENVTGKNNLPERGVYFFFEKGQYRENKHELRIVRIGTHAISYSSKATLWKRLYQHKGNIKNNGGNHRGSIFRLLIGEALINQHALNFPTWGIGQSATKDIRDKEILLEQKVSAIIRQMPFLYIPISDEPSPNSLRHYIEKNSIALLSNYNKTPIDSPSQKWLGLYSSREKIIKSGLWNQKHVDENYDINFISNLENIVNKLTFN